MKIISLFGEPTTRVNTNKENMIYIIDSFRNKANTDKANEILYNMIVNGWGYNIAKKFNFNIDYDRRDKNYMTDILHDIYLSAVHNLSNGNIDFSYSNPQIVNKLKLFIYSDMREKAASRLFSEQTPGKYNTIYSGADGYTVGMNVLKTGDIDEKDNYRSLKKKMLDDIKVYMDYDANLDILRTHFNERENIIIQNIIDNKMSKGKRLEYLGIADKEYDEFIKKFKYIVGKN